MEGDRRIPKLWGKQSWKREKYETFKNYEEQVVEHLAWLLTEDSVQYPHAYKITRPSSYEEAEDNCLQAKATHNQESQTDKDS